LTCCFIGFSSIVQILFSSGGVEENYIFVFVAIENFEQKLTSHVNTVLDQSNLSILCQKTKI